MAKNMPNASGHIGFRLDVEDHEKLIRIADILGIDLSGLLRQMIRQQLPAWYNKALELKCKTLEAEAALKR